MVWAMSWSSVISVYSNQGDGGGAHTEDLIGQIVVHGDLVDADDIVVEAGVTHGIVETVDELQEALAPSGELKQSQLSDGSTVLGYDTRDAAGNLGEVVGQSRAIQQQSVPGQRPVRVCEQRARRPPEGGGGD